MANDLEKLAKTVDEFRNDRDWKQFHNPKDSAISLVLEAAEVLEHFQWKTPTEIKAHLKARKAEVADEIADVLYWILLLSLDLDIDLGKAFTAKMRQNQQKYPVAKSKGKHTKYTELN